MGQRLLIVEDHASVAEAIRFSIAASDKDIECVGIATTIDEAMRMFAATRPDTVLMDVELPDGDGIEAVRRLKAIDPDVRVVVLTAHTSFEVLFAAADARADLVLPKEASITELADALHGPLPEPLPSFREDEGDSPRDRVPVPLTPRELEILRLLADGRTPKAIAVALGISVHTTRGHIKNVLWKLGEHSQLGAVAAASRLGIIERSMGRAG